jgi:hypothetical protein
MCRPSTPIRLSSTIKRATTQTNSSLWTKWISSHSHSIWTKFIQFNNLPDNRMPYTTFRSGMSSRTILNNHSSKEHRTNCNSSTDTIQATKWLGGIATPSNTVPTTRIIRAIATLCIVYRRSHFRYTTGQLPLKILIGWTNLGQLEF